MKKRIVCALTLLSAIGFTTDVVAESAQMSSTASPLKQEDRKAEAAKLYQLGNLSYNKKDYDEAVRLYKQALDLVDQNDLLRASILNNLAMFNSKFTNNYEAAEQLREALIISRQHRNSHLTAELQINLGNVLGLLDKYEEAEKELHAGISELHKLGDKDNEAIGYMYLAQTEENKEDRPAARKWYLKAARLFREVGDTNRADEMSQAAKISQEVRIEK